MGLINKYMLFTGWEVRIGKNCGRGLNVLTEASGPRSQFFPIRRLVLKKTVFLRGRVR